VSDCRSRCGIRRAAAGRLPGGQDSLAGSSVWRGDSRVGLRQGRPTRDDEQQGRSSEDDDQHGPNNTFRHERCRANRRVAL
jgi:hypothetical protein